MEENENNKANSEKGNLKELTYEDLRNKLKIMERDNQKINEQLFSLQNKFYIQTKILNDKTAELSKEVSNNQKLKLENIKIQKESDEVKTKITKISTEHNSLKEENQKLKNELSELTTKFNESNLKSNYLIGQLEEQNTLLTNENTSLKESLNKLKNQLEFEKNEMKAKESKIIFTLKNESQEIEMNLRNQISELQKQNETLAQESLQLKHDKESLSNELSTAVSESRSLNITNLNLVNYTVVIAQLENKIKVLTEQNNNLHFHIKRLEDNANSADQQLKSLKLEFQQSENDNKEYCDKIQEKENLLSLLESENTKLKCELEKNKSSETLMVELQEKNKTINFLLTQVDNLKRQITSDTKQYENHIVEVKENSNKIQEQLENAQSEIKSTIKTYQDKITDLKNENDQLLNDLANKDKEFTELLTDKAKLEAKFNEQFRQAELNCESIQEKVQLINQENNDLKEQLAHCVEESQVKYQELQQQITKNKDKVESFMQIYDNHISYLKERFDHILNDLLILTNLKVHPKELNEKFNALMHSIQNSIDEINKLSEREALIENFKNELKNLKMQIALKDKKIKNLENENYDLNSTLNVKRLQMKIKKPIDFANPTAKTYYQLVSLIQEYGKINELNVKLTNLKTTNQALKAEINMLNDKLSTIQNKYNSNETKVANLSNELNIKAKELNDITKSHKNEIKTLMEEVKRIKETWTPHEKKMEYITTIEELEKQIKNLKGDIARKREFINSLKQQNEKNVFQNNNVNTYNGDNSFSSASNILPQPEKEINGNIQQLNDKIKSLNKEILRKENLIKDLKSNCDNYKSTDLKIKEENENLTEKNKIHRIEIQRKDILIKDLKDKIASLNSELEKKVKSKENSNMPQVTLQRLKFENDRKDSVIKTLKSKNEALSIELEQVQNINQKISKNNTSELEREQKLHSLTKDKLDNSALTIEKMSSCIRRIFKDLLNTYESEQKKGNLGNITNSMREGMNILGVGENDMDDFLNEGDDGKIEIIQRINEIFESQGKNFETENAINLYNLLKEKIEQCKLEQNKNSQNSVNFQQRNQNPVFNKSNL